MPTRDSSEKDWSASQNKRFRANIIVLESLSMLEIRAKLADLGLAGFWEGDHGKGRKDVVGRISACLRKIGCRCVLDESQKAWEPTGVQVNITLIIGFLAL